MPIPTEELDPQIPGNQVVPGILDAECLEALREVEAIERSQVEQPPGERLSIPWPASRHPVIRKVAFEGAHLPDVRRYLGDRLILMYNAFLTKLPGGSEDVARFPWHQDHIFHPVRPSNTYVLWLALDPVDEANGCLWFHDGAVGARPHHLDALGRWELDEPLEGDGNPRPVGAGDGILIRETQAHCSRENKAAAPRRILLFQYADADAIDTAIDKPLHEHPDRLLVPDPVAR